MDRMVKCVSCHIFPFDSTFDFRGRVNFRSLVQCFIYTNHLFLLNLIGNCLSKNLGEIFGILL